MANEVLKFPGSGSRHFCFCVTASLSPADSATDWRNGTPTDVALTLSGLTNGAGRQSLKVDLDTGGTANKLAERYALFGCVDFTGEVPVQDSTIDYYWAPSQSATQANGNVAGNSGGDAACPDGALGSVTLSDFLKWCIYIGSLVVHDGASVQNGYVGILRPPSQWGQLIVVNNSGGTFEADDVEAHQVLAPIVDEIQ